MPFMSPRNAHCKGGSRAQRPFSTFLPLLVSFSLFSVLVAKGWDAGGGREGGKEDLVLYYMVGSREIIGCYIKADRTMLAFVCKHKPSTNRSEGHACVVGLCWLAKHVCPFPVEESGVSLLGERRSSTFLCVLARPKYDGYAREGGFYQPCFEGLCVNTCGLHPFTRKESPSLFITLFLFLRKVSTRPHNATTPGAGMCGGFFRDNFSSLNPLPREHIILVT